MKHIESRSSKRHEGYEFIIHCDPKTGDIEEAVSELKKRSKSFQMLSPDYKDNKGKKNIMLTDYLLHCTLIFIRTFL